MMGSLTKMDLLHFGLSLFALAAAAWVFRENIATDPGYIVIVFGLALAAHMLFWVVLSRTTRTNPAVAASLDEELSVSAGHRIFNVGMIVGIAILSMLLVPILILSARNAILAVIEVAILATGVGAGWLYRRRYRSPTLAPVVVGLALATALMWAILFGADWGVVHMRP